MRQLILSQLKCNETEDWGADECRLEVLVDGTLQPHLKRSLDNGQTWSLNQTYAFNSSVEIKLWDEDSPDADDLLGSVRITTGLTSGATAAFTRDGANYQLRYQVVDVPSVDPVASAIAAFEQSSQPGVWPHIPKAELIQDLRATVANPLNINQNYTPFCGPTAIVFELVSKQPARYVDLCRSLYETGQFRSRTKTVRPSDGLRQSKIRSGMSAADWMLIATLRDAENLIFPVTGDSGSLGNNVAGITTPWEMKGWISEILGYSQVDFESTFVYGEFDAMKTADSVRRQGGVAFVLIDAAMLGGSAPTVAYPNHWVVYQGDLSIDNGVWYKHDSGHIRFKCYSWGKIFSVDLGEGSFEDYMWGVVTGR
ncbi:hypothetical protein IQ265_12460 [Nodosilinea sp. LEGE 06152]|uniref:hypothetical protein n=1 Tax=Nodosilinea sp. LEGE 06152 TaxID=2777966 RepID=UPI0018812DA6|nr:hypothetical protein [Nodosilinea sp. LEGE 06152]MBE9157631.1 hypothetical protein [Nodosilinea sp. LEGE 06152]